VAAKGTCAECSELQEIREEEHSQGEELIQGWRNPGKEKPQRLRGG
jgi:hypothetical protein